MLQTTSFTKHLYYAHWPVKNLTTFW